MDESRIPKIVLMVLIAILVSGGVVGVYFGLKERGGGDEQLVGEEVMDKKSYSQISTSEERVSYEDVLEKETIYRNTIINFEITLPSGWDVPFEDDSVARFYKDCGTSDVFTCETALYIWEVDEKYKVDYDTLLHNPTGEGVTIEELFIFPFAKTLKLSQRNPQPLAWPFGFDWPFGYFIFPHDSNRQLIIATDNGDLEQEIISTFRLR